MPTPRHAYTPAEHRAYRMGVLAFENLGEWGDCPYDDELLEHAWFEGYIDAEEASTHYTEI